jgi:hypothetical protein
MICHLPRQVSGSSRQGALYPACLPAGYTLVSGSSSRRMDYLPGTSEIKGKRGRAERGPGQNGEEHGGERWRRARRRKAVAAAASQAGRGADECLMRQFKPTFRRSTD